LKVLLDSCIWPGARDRIADAGHEVEWVGAWDADPGDEEILARAFANRQPSSSWRPHGNSNPGYRREWLIRAITHTH
jgi:hypothetical protein